MSGVGDSRRTERSASDQELINSVLKTSREYWNSTDRGAGVYLLMERGELIYVGSSKNVDKRLREHRQNGRQFDCAHVISCPIEHAITIESQLIKRLEPSENIRGLPHRAATERARHAITKQDLSRLLISADAATGSASDRGFDRSLSNVVMSEEDAAVALNLSVRSLQRLRVDGGGPRYVMLTKRRLGYTRASLDEWVNERSVSSTSQVAASRLGRAATARYRVPELP